MDLVISYIRHSLLPDKLMYICQWEEIWAWLSLGLYRERPSDRSRKLHIRALCFFFHTLPMTRKSSFVWFSGAYLQPLEMMTWLYFYTVKVWEDQMVNSGEMRSYFMKFQWQLTSVKFSFKRRRGKRQIFETESSLPFHLYFHFPYIFSKCGQRLSASYLWSKSYNFHHLTTLQHLFTSKCLCWWYWWCFHHGANHSAAEAAMLFCVLACSGMKSKTCTPLILNPQNPLTFLYWSLGVRTELD